MGMIVRQRLIEGIFVTLIVFGNLNPEFARCEMLDRRYIRGAVANVPPFDLLTVYPNGSFHYAGSSRLIIEWLAIKMNLSLVFVLPNEEEVKERGNEASLDIVARGKADFSSTGFAITPARYARLEPATYPSWSEGHLMAVPKPGEKDRLFAFIDPFDWNVWLLTGVSFVAVSLFMGLLTWASARYTYSDKSKQNRDTKVSDYLGQYFLYNVNVLTTHGDYLSESRVSFLVGVGCWLLGASILVYGYSSLVVSAITIPSQLPAINSFEDVVAHPEISLIIRTDTLIGALINSSNDVPLYRALRDQASKRPESIGNEGVINSTKLLLTGKYAYPMIESVVKFTVGSQYVREGQCRFKLSKSLPLSNNYFHNYFQKGNKKLIREYSIGLMQLTETGIIRHWVKTLPWLPKADECFAKASKKTTGSASSIKLRDLASAFFILGVGLAVSALGYLAEILLYHRTRN